MWLVREKAERVNEASQGGRIEACFRKKNVKEKPQSGQGRGHVGEGGKERVEGQGRQKPLRLAQFQWGVFKGQGRKASLPVDDPLKRTLPHWPMAPRALALAFSCCVSLFAVALGPCRLLISFTTIEQKAQPAWAC